VFGRPSESDPLQGACKVIAIPVILLTAKGATADKAKGLDLGADDYVAKPFHPDELAARVRAVIRRATGAAPGAGGRSSSRRSGQSSSSLS
jgi:DNA-binding response OmpR family regulator